MIPVHPSDDLPGPFALLVAVYRQAIRDAKRGDKSAKRFLHKTIPGWERLIVHAGPVDLVQLERAEQAAVSERVKTLLV